MSKMIILREALSQKSTSPKYILNTPFASIIKALSNEPIQKLRSLLLSDL